MKRWTKGIHKIIREQTQLADAYAQDGAFHSAAKIYTQLGREVEAHAKWCDGETDKLITKHNDGVDNEMGKLQRSAPSPEDGRR